jgi:arylsulfatase A
MRKLAVHMFFAFLGISHVVGQKEDLPNIVLIAADDLGSSDLHMYGNESVKTPNIDRLANEGIRFTDFHANGPMCSPTRAALLSGRYQQRTGVEEVGGVIKENEVLISERLRDDAGYRTGVFGKWHISGHLSPVELI